MPTLRGSVPEPTHPHYRIWVRRQAEWGGSYSLRFEVARGRGLLRVARPGVTVDPPARASGQEDGLTASQVLQSRFLYAGDGQRGRRALSLGRVDIAALSGLYGSDWVELRETEADGGAWLELPATRGEGEEDTEDQPTDVLRMIAELRAHLRDASPVIDDAPPPRVPAARAATGGVAAEDMGFVFDEFGAEPPPPRPAAPVATPAEPAEPAQPAQPAEPAAAAGDEVPGAGLHARRTTLVRHLRRKLVDAQLRALELEARVSVLEGQKPR